MSIANQSEFPRWFKMMCCVVPLGALFAVSVGLAWGISVSPIVLFTLAALAWRVIAKVLGIEQKMVSIHLPQWRQQKAITSESRTE